MTHGTYERALVQKADIPVAARICPEGDGDETLGRTQKTQHCHGAMLNSPGDGNSLSHLGPPNGPGRSPSQHQGEPPVTVRGFFPFIGQQVRSSLSRAFAPTPNGHGGPYRFDDAEGPRAL
jgi:hypothetical protein